MDRGMRARLEFLEQEEPDLPIVRIARAAECLYGLGGYQGSPGDAVTDAAAVLAAADSGEVVGDVIDLRDRMIHPSPHPSP